VLRQSHHGPSKSRAYRSAETLGDFRDTASRLLYDISAVDPTAWSAAIALLLTVTAIANVVPARRAAVVDPSSALRAE
jgi:ABC-type lipoprotein release transport system permease subunit